MNYFIRPIMINSKFKDYYSSLLSVFFPLLLDLLKILWDLLKKKPLRHLYKFLLSLFYQICQNLFTFYKGSIVEFIM